MVYVKHLLLKLFMKKNYHGTKNKTPIKELWKMIVVHFICVKIKQV